MESIGVIAVVGVCRPERQGYARRLAASTGRALLPASQVAVSPDPAHEAVILAFRKDPATGAVLELPDEVPVTDVIGAFADHEPHARLLGLVCVADAAHLLDDLHRDDHVALRDAESGAAARLEASAQLAVTQLEYASTIVLVNWAPLSPEELAVVMALVNHLSPRARLRLHREGTSHLEFLEFDEPYSAGQDRAGWICLLNGDFDPHMTDRRVSALRYEQIRPLHPGRLQHLLDERIEPGEFGLVVRSAGFCRLATRPGVVGQWEHVGRVISLNPLAIDTALSGDEELLALGQDLAFIGIGLDHAGLAAALDEAALTDDEIVAGPSAWAGFADPFPAWATATDWSE